MICPSYPPRATTCGVGDYTRRLVDEVCRQGVDVSVVCSSGYDGNPVTPARVIRNGHRWTVAEAPHIVRAIAGSFASTILHLQYTPALFESAAFAPALALLGRRRGARVVVTLHSLTGGALASRAAALALIAAATTAISANEEVTQMVRRRAPRLARRLVEIPIGANVEPPPAGPVEAGTVRAALGLPANGPLIAHFGLVYPGKGLETLLAAVADLRRHRPDLRLVVIGDVRAEDARYRAGLEAVAQAVGLGGAVTWTGRRSADEVSRILRIADVYAVPFDDGASTRRGSLIAGLAHRLPVVTTTPRVPSMDLRDGAVALVPPHDPSALAAAIGSILASPAEAERLRAGAARLASRFEWPVIARETIDVYQRALGR